MNADVLSNLFRTGIQVFPSCLLPAYKDEKRAKKYTAYNPLGSIHFVGNIPVVSHTTRLVAPLTLISRGDLYQISEFPAAVDQILSLASWYRGLLASEGETVSLVGDYFLRTPTTWCISTKNNVSYPLHLVNYSTLEEVSLLAEKYKPKEIEL